MYRILLVDDSQVMRRMLRNALAGAGFDRCEYCEASNGQEALARLAEAHYKVDAIFCDLCMPKMDGLELLNCLSEQGLLKSCPIIILTADARKTHCSEILLRGASALLRKPFTADDVAGALRKLLSLPEPTRA